MIAFAVWLKGLILAVNNSNFCWILSVAAGICSEGLLLFYCPRRNASSLRLELCTGTSGLNLICILFLGGSIRSSRLCGSRWFTFEFKGWPADTLSDGLRLTPDIFLAFYWPFLHRRSKYNIFLQGEIFWKAEIRRENGWRGACTFIVWRRHD